MAGRLHGKTPPPENPASYQSVANRAAAPVS